MIKKFIKKLFGKEEKKTGAATVPVAPKTTAARPVGSPSPASSARDKGNGRQGGRRRTRGRDGRDDRPRPAQEKTAGPGPSATPPEKGRERSRRRRGEGRPRPAPAGAGETLTPARLPVESPPVPARRERGRGDRGGEGRRRPAPAGAGETLTPAKVPVESPSVPARRERGRGDRGGGPPREGARGRDRGRDRDRSRGEITDPHRIADREHLRWQGQEPAPAEPAAAAWPELPPIPPWTPPEDPTRFANYDLPESVRQGIEGAGFTDCTTIQSKTLPLALQGFDIAAQSQTGTGKTAAFLITAFSRLHWRGPVGHPGPRMLVISPTRELTVQIENDARMLGSHTGFSIAVAFGGVDYEKQRRELQAGPDLLIGTPGRLIDFLKQGVWRPEGVEILVIDEADRMFDMGFVKDLRFILKRLPPYERRQTMLFSATLSWRVLELTYEYMNLPKEIKANPEHLTVEKTEEVLYHVPRVEKAALFLGLLKSEPWTRAIVFANMKSEAEKVERLLMLHGFHARAITGNLEQAKRLSLMEEFKSGTLPILVATDVASRGLHIEAVSHVFNWDLPQDPEDYVHRIGRTARAGAAGKAISLADEHTVLHLDDIEKLISYKIPVIWHDTEHLAEVKPGWERGPRDDRERHGGPGGRSSGGRPGDRGRRSTGGGSGGRTGGSRGGRPRR